MSNDRIKSEMGLIRPYVEAELVMASGRTANISGGPYQSAARLLRYLRLRPNSSNASFNTRKANELAGVLLGIAALVRARPDVLKNGDRVIGLDEYAPQSDKQKAEYPRLLVLEGCTLLRDALRPYLDTGDSRTAPGWAVRLLKSINETEDVFVLESQSTEQPEG